MVQTLSTPALLLEFESPVKFGSGIKRVEGTHGLERECYQTKDLFLVLEQNVVGEGYEISINKPVDFNKLQCRLRSEHPTNKMAISIGTIKSVVETKLDVKFPDSSGIIQWISKNRIRSIEYDVQTTAEFQFSDSKLIRIRVFTTTTN